MSISITLDENFILFSSRNLKRFKLKSDEKIILFFKFIVPIRNAILFSCVLLYWVIHYADVTKESDFSLFNPLPPIMIPENPVIK